MKQSVLLKNITKIYPNGVIANNDVTLSFDYGTIHAIAGENGAGKSTIMKILAGYVSKTSGDIYINDEKVNITSTKVSSKYGIGMVYQHFMLIKEYQVYQNIFLGIELKNKFGFLDKKKMIDETRKIADEYGMKVNPLSYVKDLSVGEAQKVEILKVLIRGSKIIILDEPTAILTPQESEQLFLQIKKLKEKGCLVIIITHHIKEIKEWSDKISIMRKGAVVGEYKTKDLSEEEISSLMMGKNSNFNIIKTKVNPKEKVLEVKNLKAEVNNKKTLSNVSFSLYKNEITCLVGVEGNGQDDLFNILTGANKKYSGEVLINNINIKKMNTKAIRDNHVSIIPEDRIKSGSNINSSVFENLIPYKLKDNSCCGFIKTNKLKNELNETIIKYKIKGSLKDKLGTLSGGNIQKVIVGREFDNKPILVLANQPTRGVDIGAINFIHQNIIRLRDEDVGFLIISSDLSEVFEISDRVIVFYGGEIVLDTREVEDLSQEKLGQYMLGIKKDAKNA